MSSSPRARMMKKMTRPAMAYARIRLGPALEMALPAPQEEAGADGSADRDHLDLAGAERAVVTLAALALDALAGLLAVLLDLHRGHVFGAPFLHADPRLGLAADRVLDPPDTDGVARRRSAGSSGPGDMGGVPAAVVKIYHVLMGARAGVK
ncbi:hypothetical protein GCM10020254_52870 [Streptomyces goshikiensis]